MDEFQKRYQSFDNQKLLKIIENADSYQASAVEAAKLELSKRNVSSDEIQFVKDEISNEKAKKEERKRQITEVENKAKKAGTDFFDIINPIQNKDYTTDRKISTIVIFFGLMSVYQLYSNYPTLEYIFNTRLAEWDFFILKYLLIFILLPISVFLFWKRKIIGWMLMCAIFVHGIFTSIQTFFFTWKYSRATEIYEGDARALIEFIDSFSYSRLDLIILPLLIAFYAANLWIICTSEIRDVFQISQKTALICISVAAIFSLFVI